MGIVAAALVYWLQNRSNDLSDDPSMLGYDRAESRQMGMLYGQSGQLIDQWLDDLKQPGTQAVIIVLFTAAIAGGCFYFARLSDYDDGAN